MKYRFLFSLLFLCSLSWSSPSYGWNYLGHAIIAELAYRNLTEAQRTQYAELLKSHPHYKPFLAADLPQGVSVGEWAFIRAANWPDWVRPSRPGDRQFKDPTVTKFHRSTWHYVRNSYEVDRKAEPSSQPTSQPQAAAEPMTGEVNLPQALADNRTILADETVPAADRAVALCWVMHLTGDLHQPLHAVSMVSRRFPQGDKGGNDQAVNTGTGVMNLHALWDDMMGTAQSYPAISFLAGDLLRDPRCDVHRIDEYRTHPSAADWEAESHEQAVSFAYLDGELSTAVMKDYQSKKITVAEVPLLPPMYLHNARDVARVRISLAAARLADELKDPAKK